MNGINCEKVILDWPAKEHSKEIINCAAAIIKNECKQACKRDSGSILRKTDYCGLFNFTLDSLESEFQEKCPSLLQVLESAVCDVPIPRSIDNKLYTNLMVSVSMVMHTSQEMSALHYRIGFVLASGSCTQKVRIIFNKISCCIIFSFVMNIVYHAVLFYLFFLKTNNQMFLLFLLYKKMK